MTFSSKRKLVSSKTKPLCQGLSCQESCRADARLRGWTKDAFRVSGITQVLLCTTSPTSSLRSMPPPLVGEALAGGAGQTSPSRLRRATSPDKGRLCGGEVLSQHRVLLRNEISLSMALPLGELARQRLRGQARQNKTRKHSDTMSLTNRACIAVFFAFCQHPCPLRHGFAVPPLPK